MPSIDDLCDPAPVPASPTATIGVEDAFHNLIEAAAAGDVFVLEAGTYTLADTIDVTADGVSVIGVDRDAVVIEVAAGSTAFDVKSSRFTVANLTIRGGETSVRFQPGGATDTSGGTVRYTVLDSPDLRHIEIDDQNGGVAVGGEVICNKMLHDPGQCDGTDNSSRAVLAHPAPAWRFSTNEVRDTYCEDRPVAAFALQEGDGAIADNNIFFNGDAAIHLGPFFGPLEPCSGGGEISGAVVCNNLVHHSRSSSNGSIELRGACDAGVVHNAVYSESGAPSIELNDPSSGLVANNASNGPGDLDGGSFDPDLLQTNVLAPRLEFKDPDQLDLRVIDGAGSPADLSSGPAALETVCGTDFLGAPRDLQSPAAIGAFEQLAP